MGTVKSLLLGMCFVLGACTSQTSTVQTTEKGTQWEWQNGTIVVKTPERPAGQKSVLGLTTPKLEAVRVGFVGLGMRGPGAVERFTYIPGTQVVALCDYEEARADKCQELLKKASMPKAAVYSGDKGYEELCKRGLYCCRLAASLPRCQVCVGEWKECSDRSAFGYESAGMLGFD